MTLQEERTELIKKKNKLEGELEAVKEELKEVETAIVKELTSSTDPKDNYLTW